MFGGRVVNSPERGIRWLGRFAHPPGRRERFTVVLSAYLDASGQGTKDPVAVVAGFVTNEDGWATFEKAWQLFLHEFGLVRFHVAPYWARQRPFDKWNEAKWLAAQSAICKAIASVKLLGVGVALSVRVFDEWRMTLDQYYPDDPYYFCLDRVLYHLISGLSETPKDEGITIYIDNDKQYEDIGLRVAKWHMDRLRRDPSVRTEFIAPDRPVDTHYGSSLDLKPLQLADILSHATFQTSRDRLLNDYKGSPSQIFIKAMVEAEYRLQISAYDNLRHLQSDLRDRFTNRDALGRYGQQS